MMSTSSSMQLGASAMNAYSWGMAVTAHNVANVNTAGFEPQRAVYANNSHNQGVSFDAVLKDAGSAAAQTLTGLPPKRFMMSLQAFLWKHPPQAARIFLENSPR